MKWPWTKPPVIIAPTYPCLECGSPLAVPDIPRHIIGSYVGQPLYCDGKI